MQTILPWLTLALAGLNLILLLVILLRPTRSPREGLENAIHEEARASRQESANYALELRQEIAGRLDASSEATQRQAEVLRTAVEAQLKSLQESNEHRLDQMQHLVDEKLQTTLDRRLGESFTLVSERLEAVQRGLGEMQALATGVGDLKRVLSNVKARGTWGEIQLGSVLEQMLTPDQYSCNVQTKRGSRETVEFAVKLPGMEGESGLPVWLPIDAKFPQEDYLRLMDAVDKADADGVLKATASLVRSTRASAEDITAKYLDPPNTTDFAIMFLPTEGLYAEILRQPGLVEELQQTYRIVVAGPTTLSAILSSLRMGFRTLAIAERSSEVWHLLGAVKTEFSKFGKVIEKVKKQLSAASKSIEDTSTRTRAMERTLRSVEELPAREASRLLTDSLADELPVDATDSEEADEEPPF